MDSHWFWHSTLGDRVIVRMHVHTPPGKAAVTEIRAYVVWNDDMFYNRHLIVFEHDDDKGHSSVRRFQREASRQTRLPLSVRRHRHSALRPLDPFLRINRSMYAEWEELYEDWTADWPEAWRTAEDVVCTKGPDLAHAEPMSVRNPLALVQLARFQMAARFRRGGWGITLDIIEQRLGGVIRANLR